MKLKYYELTALFRAVEKITRTQVHVKGKIRFTEDSFQEKYSEEARTYIVGSDCKAFQPGMLGYSIYGSSEDGSDRNVRLDTQMRAEKGGKLGWKVESCFMTDEDYALAMEALATERANNEVKKAYASGVETKCPRCGEALARRNALSRAVDLDVCPDCGTDEALRALNGNPLPVREWWIFKHGKKNYLEL